MGRRDPAVLGHTPRRPDTGRSVWGAASPGSAPAFDARSEWVLSIRIAHADALACLERRHTAFSAAATGALAVDGVTAWPPAGGAAEVFRAPGSAPAFDARSEWVLSIRVALADAFACTERRHIIRCGRNGGSGSGRRNGLATRGGAAEVLRAPRLSG